MEAFYAIENRLSSIFLQRRKSFLLRYPLRLAHRQALSQTSRTTIDELPGRHHLHEPYIARLLAVDCHSHRLLQSTNTGRGAAASSLLTAEEIESVQGELVIDTHSNSQTGRGFVVSQCYFQLHTSANSISLNVTQKSDGPDARDPKEYWRHSFHREDESGQADRKDKRQEEEEEERKSPPERVPDLGDEAFWTGSHVGSALYVIKRDVFIRISVGGSGDLASNLRRLLRLL